MKFSTVLLAALAVFSPVVLSQKVDPLASSSVVRTATTEADDVSPTAQLTDHTTTTPLEESIVDKRGLNAPTTAPLCKKFKNYVAVDDGKTTLQAWCKSKNCCSTGGVVGQNNECANWSTEPDTTYEVCENSCVGQEACKGVASNALGGSSIRFEKGSCSHTSGFGYSCYEMAFKTEKKVNIRVGENSCTNWNSCYFMAKDATNLEELIIENSCTNEFSCLQMAYSATNLEELIIENSCTNEYSCAFAAFSATSLKYLSIENSCSNQDSCYDCGRESTFDETLQLTQECCAAESGELPGANFDTACQYSEPSASPSSSPSISSIPSIQPSSIPSDIPSDVPSDQPSSVPSDVPSDQPSSVPSDVPSNQPSNLPSSEPSWLDDEQCKKKDPENDICAELDGRCKIDCEDDEDFVCVPGLCSYDKKWDKSTKSTKSPKMRQLMNGDVEIIDMEITATGNAERKLKSKATKAPKSSCACRVPRRHKCN